MYPVDFRAQRKESSLTSAHGCIIRMHSKGQPPSHGNGGLCRGKRLAGTLCRVWWGALEWGAWCSCGSSVWLCGFSFLELFASGRTDSCGRHAVSANILSGLTNNCWTKPAAIFIGILFFTTKAIYHTPLKKTERRNTSECFLTSQEVEAI